MGESIAVAGMRGNDLHLEYTSGRKQVVGRVAGPRGEAGPQGPQGEPGPQGPRGEDGSQVIVGEARRSWLKAEDLERLQEVDLEIDGVPLTVLVRAS